MKQDFGKILEQWEQKCSAKAAGRLDGAAGRAKRTAAEADAAVLQRRWLEMNGVIDKDKGSAGENPAERGKRLKDMRPQDSIDLHLFTREEAWRALEGFFASARRRGLEKVLIIHGKGLHSGGGGVLRDMCAQFLEQCECAGKRGYAGKEMGGSGATWVILK
ncbi:MAG: Smr/MutS family protein [Spirochaetaceae bacterium]|jgi:DNA-nicking Smr family endonuclease|nr:Smr/MutS family protein [Spirochaetaceae bacterium]